MAIENTLKLSICKFRFDAHNYLFFYLQSKTFGRIIRLQLTLNVYARLEIEFRPLNYLQMFNYQLGAE
jgi:hypothetical protein